MRVQRIVPPFKITPTSRSISCYLAVALPVVLLPTILVAFILNILVGLPPAYSEEQSVLRKLISSVLFAPWAETLLMGWLIHKINKITARIPLIVLVSATAWAAFHSIAMRYWGLVVFWPFLVYSVSFLVWEKISNKCALLVVTTLHAAHNLLSLMLSIILS